MASCEASDLAKERLRFGGLMGGPGRLEYKDSNPTTSSTNHCHMAWLCPLNHEWLRFSQIWHLFNTLISIVSSFYHPISVRSTEKVNFMHKLNFKPILTHFKVFGPSESKFDIYLSVWSIDLHELNILPNKHIKIHKLNIVKT